MKKFLAILMAICMMATLLCVSAFAAEPENKLPEPATGTVLRITAIRGNETVLIGDHTNFEDGWNAAMEIAGSEKTMNNNGYERIVVDFYTDWTADQDGGFTDDTWNGAGFDNDTIYIPADAKVTLNLNNHTINRGLTKDINDGEVMFINDDADVIINNGTITGGNSSSEGGGLYIEGGVNITLNNVNIVGNRVFDDDGAGIYMYGGSTLTMKGGSLQNNSVGGEWTAQSGGAIYLDNSTATFSNVEFKANTSEDRGSAIRAFDSKVTIDKCTFDGNTAQYSMLEVEDGTLVITNSKFINNVGGYVLEPESTTMIVDSCEFINNNSPVIYPSFLSTFEITNSKFENNSSYVMYADMLSVSFSFESFFRNCMFNNNGPANSAFYGDFSDIAFYDCGFGNSNFNEAEDMKIEYSNISEGDAVIGVTLVHKDGTEEKSSYKFFDYGWNFAIKAAQTNTYERVVVDLLTDWTAVDGEFCNSGVGFNWDAIYFPENVKVTLNLNGFTIDRGLTEDDNQNNGEVICIDENADVIINNGTITGGNSDNGAGGIHIKDGATVTLNDVHIKGNITDGDKGAGIAMYNGATLTMNGGSFTSNLNVSFNNGCGAAIYIYSSTATFNGVRFYDNQFQMRSGFGAALYATRSTVTMDNCEVISNGLYGKIDAINGHGSYSTIHATESTILTIKNTTTKANGSSKYSDDVQLWQTNNDLSVIRVKDSSEITIDSCTITENLSTHYILSAANVNVYASNTAITGNTSSVYKGHIAEFTNCTFGDNGNNPAFDIRTTNQDVIFTDCEMGDSTYNNIENAKFVDSDSKDAVGSIFGEGSLTMIVAILALASSAVSIFLTVYYNKKKAVPVAANNAEETEDEE